MLKKDETPGPDAEMSAQSPQSPVQLRVVDGGRRPADEVAQAELDFTAEELERRAVELADLKLARNSERAYRADWEHFTAWCASFPGEEKRVPLPATQATVRLYIAAHSKGKQMLAASTLTRRLVTIARIHRKAGLEPPTVSDAVRNVMIGTRRAQVDDGILPVRKMPLRTGDVKSAVLRLPTDKALISARNRLILLLGFAGAFRRSELVGLNVADIELVEEGMVVTLRKSKTDQLGAGKKKGIPFGEDDDSCPVNAYQAWIKAAAIKRGPVFRPVDRHGNVSEARLSGEAVSIIVKQGVVALGKDADSYAAHSLRAGLITSAFEAGGDSADIMAMSGHTKRETMDIYVRDRSLFNRNAAKTAGL